MESLLSSVLVGAALFLFGERIASLQGAVGGGIGYRVIAPAVLLVAMLSALKGWFNGNMDLLPSAISIMVEQGVKLLFGISLAYLFRDRGAYVAAAAALGGVTLSELVATFTIGGVYFSKRTKSTSEYFLGGRKLGPFVTAMSAEASDMSSWLLMGLPGVALAGGLCEASWTAIGLAVGYHTDKIYRDGDPCECVHKCLQMIYAHIISQKKINRNTECSLYFF